MGLGKTLQALCTLEGPSLVAAPTSVLANWRDELRRFRPELGVNLYHGPDRALDDADVTITSHALLRLDAERLTARRYAVFVLDEAQAIKNPETGLAKAAFAVDAGFRVSLTGTPVENRLDELWSQMRLLNPGLLGSRSDFEERYVRPVAEGRPEPLERLRRRLRPFVLRRLKSEGRAGAASPNRAHPCAPSFRSRSERSMTPSASRCARTWRRRSAARPAPSKRSRRSCASARPRAIRRSFPVSARRARRRPSSCSSSSIWRRPRGTRASSSRSGPRCSICWSPGFASAAWTSCGSTARPGTARPSWRDSATTSRSRPSLISLKAGGTGLNLTAADHVFLFEPWWNPAVEEQAFDRAHRIGQTRPVFVHRLVAADTVEDRMLKLQADKRALAEGALGAPASPLTREDLLGLLE